MTVEYSVGVWVVIVAFLGELIVAIPFSIYVLRDALRDYRLVRADPAAHPDPLVITEMFIKTETARLVKMSSFLAVVILAIVRPGWYLFASRSLFLVIGAALAYNSVKEYRTRRRLVMLQRGGGTG